MTEEEQLFSTISRFSTGMLTTVSKELGITCRPMQILRGGEKERFLMVSKAHSEKVAEIEENHQACISFQDRSNQFASLSGEAKIVRNNKELKELWNSSLEAWLPEGPESANVVIIEFLPQFGEYWDNSGWKRIKTSLQLATSLASGEPPQMDKDQHGSVEL